MKTRIYETQLKRTTTEEGVSIEQRMRKAIESGEKITDTAEIVYTEKKDGVLPQYDVRTDKWEIAMQAMDAATKSDVAKVKAAQALEEEHDKNKDK